MTWNSGLGYQGFRSAADDANDGDDSEQTVSKSRVEERIVAARQLFDQACKWTQKTTICCSLLDGLQQFYS